ncbi:MAG: anaerobic ribonucleoside-triphosphate reductase activating protein [Lachnospiraceae bacterium]|nr:anaerobic ribonucleoside-triphosphate reductase activating protein [Lachnospiraceae bacterium]
MRIHGFSKTTLLDYPGHVACMVFTGGCNFRCPFCHNGDLVLHPDTAPMISEEEFFTFLKKRQNVLDGVCVTGGEPTLSPDLEDFIRKIRQFDLLVKLDTNGYRPQVLESLLKQHLLDYVAMDIKNSKEKYPMTTGIPGLDVSPVDASVQLLLRCDIPFEFRTTVVKELHHVEDFTSIGEWIKGAPAYFLQCYKDSEQVISPGFTSPDLQDLQLMKDAVLPFVPGTELRGIDQ